MENWVPGLPPLPWQVAPEDPPDTEIVAEFEGEWEPKRECVFYGPVQPSWLHDRPDPKPSSTLRLRRFHDVIVAPHHVILSYRDGRLLPVTFALGTRWSLLKPGFADQVAEQWFNPMRCPGDPLRTDSPCFLAEGGWDHFGHTLLEMMPKLAMRSSAGEATVVSSARYLNAFFEALGADPSGLAIFRGPLFCKTLFVPDPPVDLSGNFHSLARRAYADLCHMVGAGSPNGRRIFLSRAAVPVRPLSNEREVEALFARYGFEIVALETMPLADQIRLIASAEMIAGGGGSAMHALVFADARTRALVLNSDRWLSPIDQFIAQQHRQLAYVLGSSVPQDGKPSREWSWSVDISLVEHAIHEHFGL